MKVTIISHAYIAPENQKNIKSLSKFCDVLCLVPRRTWIPMYRKYLEVSNQEEQAAIKPFHTLSLTASQFIFLSFELDFIIFKPDIINIEYHPWSLPFLQILLYRYIFCRQAKIVCTVKKNTYELRQDLLGIIKNLLVRITIKKVDHFICSSRMTANLYTTKLAVPNNKVTVCHHLAVDTLLFRPSDAKSARSTGATKRFVVGYCGRFDEEKGLLDLVEAVRLITKSGNRNILLRLLGGGTSKNPLDVDLEKLRLSVDWLEIINSVTHEKVPEFMRTLDLFVLPSRNVFDHQEHDAHALLEAMACGVACIGTRSGIIPEILDKYDACLVEPGQPQDLANAITQLIGNSAKRRLLADAARTKALREFALDAVAKCRIAAYNKIIDKSQLG